MDNKPASLLVVGLGKALSELDVEPLILFCDKRINTQNTHDKSLLDKSVSVHTRNSPYGDLVACKMN